MTYKIAHVHINLPEDKEHETTSINTTYTCEDIMTAVQDWFPEWESVVITLVKRHD